MSFILDALRKSDTQRQEQTGPGLATTQQRAQKKTRNIWIPALVGVLVLNALVVGWVFLKTPETDESLPASISPHPDAGAATRSLRKEAQPTQPEPVLSPSAETIGGAVATPGAEFRMQQVKPALTAPTAEAITALPATPESKPAANVAAAEEPLTLPSFQQLVVAGLLSMPDLHLDIHVYAGDTEKRFVFINMKKYRESERLSEGPVIEAITNTGVILAHQGNRFTLERN